MLILADFWFLFDVIFELGVVITTEQPLEDCLLNLLVVFLLEKVIVEKLH